MSAFEYKALTEQGKTKSGIIEADTLKQVRQKIRKMDLIPLEVHEVIQKQKKVSQGLFIGGGLSTAELAVITRQMATLLGSGSPLEETLATVVKQSESGGVRRMISSIRTKVLEGYPLESALNMYPSAFPGLFRATVGAGEKSGHLSEVLERLADYTEDRQLNQQKVSTAFVYPLLLAVVSIAIVVALLKFVVPNVISVFESFEGQLPLITRGLIASSDFVENYGIYVLVGLMVFLAIFFSLLRQPKWKKRWHRFILKLPLIGRLIRGTNTENFARTLSILSSSGVPILDAMSIAGSVMTNVPMRDSVTESTHKVREGMSIHKALQQSGYFPPMVIYLIASGEGSGKLDNMLERAAIQQERETQAKLNKLVSLMEPAMILIMGGLVMLIVMAIMMPILSMPQFIK